MNTQKHNCEENSVSMFLENQMDVDVELEFKKHLDECPECRERLTTAAAQQDWWDETREFLGTREEHAELSETLGFLNPTDDPRMLGRFGGYEIAGLIGQGGMGIVLKAFDHSLNRYAAIKVLAPQLATSANARNRFAREAKAAAAVVHDNVIAIHGVNESAGLPYLVMPYVRGESLQKRIDNGGAMTALEIVRVGLQVAKGLAAAHAQGLVHRDIKPANILMPSGVQRILITDFGLARAIDESNLTRTGTIAGTPQFMSPEQARGESIDPRSDLFSLGTVMYVMCTGRNPFRAENPYGIIRRIIEDQPRPIREINPDIPVWLATIVNRLQAKNPAERFQSAAAVAELLEGCLASLQNSSVPLPAELKRSEPTRVKTGLKRIVIGLVLGSALVAGGLMIGWFAPPEPQQDTKQQESKQQETKQQSAKPTEPLKQESAATASTSAELAATSLESSEVDVLSIIFEGQAVAQKVWYKARANPDREFIGELAREYSIEPVTRDNFGKCDPIRRDGKHPALEDEAFRLKPGELSALVQVDDRWVLMFCLATDAQEVEPGEEAMRKKLTVLTVQMTSLQQEGNFLAAKTVEKRILTILRGQDKDIFRIEELRKSMIENRLDGKHEAANQAANKIRELEKSLHHRYHEIDDIRQLEESVRRRLRPLTQQLLEKTNGDDDILRIQNEIEAMEAQLKTEYLAGDSGPVSSISKAAEHERRIKLLDATAAFEVASQNLLNKKAAFINIDKLQKRGFAANEAVEEASTAVKLANIELEKATLVLEFLKKETHKGNGR